jgi:hypothetical protein
VSPSYDDKIVIGDMNALAGKEEIYCPTIRKQSLHMVIEARHRSDLLDFRSYRGGNVDSII